MTDDYAHELVISLKDSPQGRLKFSYFFQLKELLRLDLHYP